MRRVIARTVLLEIAIQTAIDHDFIQWSANDVIHKARELRREIRLVKP